jgi:hypothetical protein
VKKLLYGDEKKTVTVAQKQGFAVNKDEPDYLEKSYIKYFNDEKNLPVELIVEVHTGEDRKAIIDPDERYIYSLLPEVPAMIRDLLKYAGQDVKSVESSFHPPNLRGELLMMMYFDSVPAHVNKDNVCVFVDEKLQGSVTDTVKMEFTKENIEMLAHIACDMKTVEGFGGIMRKYCPKRLGPVLDAVVHKLIATKDANKLVALLTNRVSHTPLYKLLDDSAWQPLSNIDMKVVGEIIGEKELDMIEHANVGKNVVHCYRVSNLANRHGYGNHKPYMFHGLKFISYAKRQ